MLLKLNNCQNLEYLSNASDKLVSDDIAVVVDGIFIKSCPKINGYLNLKKIYDAQVANNDVVLDHVRVDIGNVSGSITELMQYADMNGYDDSGEHQTKPRLIGTWNVNYWYTQEQITIAESIFDGLNIMGDTNYLINFDNMAVQVLDNTKPNYNPSASIILQQGGYGILLDEPIISGQTGRWFISKNQAASIVGDLNVVFQGENIVDTNKIVSSQGLTYNIENFDEFVYFTSITVTTRNMFRNAKNIDNISLPNSITTINAGLAYLRDADWPEITITIPQNCTSVSNIAGYATTLGVTNASYILHFLEVNPPTIVGDLYQAARNVKVYVGDGSSAANDNAILQTYLADSNWAGYSSIIDTWYNYLHPTV